jgi:hypothetical protein
MRRRVLDVVVFLTLIFLFMGLSFAMVTKVYGSDLSKIPNQFSYMLGVYIVLIVLVLMRLKYY